MIADIIGGLGSQYMTEHLGWTGMIRIIAGCAFLGEQPLGAVLVVQL